MIANIYEQYQPWRKLLFWPRPCWVLTLWALHQWTLCLKVRLTHIKIHHYSFWFCCYYCYDLHPLTCQLLQSEGLLVFPVSHCKFRVSLIFVGLCMLTFKKPSWRHWPKIFAFLWHFSQSELSEDYRRAGKLHIETFGIVSLGFVIFFFNVTSLLVNTFIFSWQFSQTLPFLIFYLSRPVIAIFLFI